MANFRWTLGLGLLAGLFGIWFSFQKGDGPSPNWGFFAQAANTVAGAVLFGLVGAVPGLVLDLIGMLWRRTRRVAQAMREQSERLS